MTAFGLMVHVFASFLCGAAFAPPFIDRERWSLAIIAFLLVLLYWLVTAP